MHVSVGDVAVDSHSSPTKMAVKIPSSKMDQFSQGVTITIGKGSATLRPIAAMLQYLARRPSNPGPLFIERTGRHLTKQVFISQVKQALARSGIASNAYT